MADETKSLQEKIGDWLKKTYETNKVLFFTAGLVIGLIFLAIKYHNLIIDILIGSAKELNKEALKKDAELAVQANKTKSEADALVDKAKSESSKEKPVPDDWFKK